MGNNFNFLINSVSLIAIVSGYLISRNIYQAFSRALLEVEQYYSKSEKLQNDIDNDFLTGALSKTFLYKKLAENSKNKIYKTISFIDLDDFKMKMIQRSTA